jgi:hypothetical protein
VTAAHLEDVAGVKQLRAAAKQVSNLLFLQPKRLQEVHPGLQ